MDRILRRFRQRSLPPQEPALDGPRFSSTLAHLLCTAVCALLLALAAFSLGPSTPARAAASELQLSTPVALTSLATGGLSLVSLDDQRHFHLLYTTTTPQNEVNLVYRVVSSDGQSVQQIRQPLTLTRAADRIDSAALVLDSQNRLHAAWIEVRNGTFSILHALVEDPTAGSANPLKIETLYQSSEPVEELSGGADSNGNTFFSWLDSSGGASNLSIIELHDDQSIDNPLHLTHQTDRLNFPHLLVYPDGTLTAVMLHQSPKGGWDVIIWPFDAGSSLHDPTTVATQLHPGPNNQISNTDVMDFRFDPLAVNLDAQQHLHIAWGAILQLGYADATMLPDHSFAFQTTTLSSATYNYQELCLSAGPVTTPSTTPGPSSLPWLVWLDDTQGTLLHPFIDQVNKQRQFRSAPRSLVDRFTAAISPCVEQDSQGGLYVTWQQYNDSGDNVLMMVTTTRAPLTPFWVELGLNRTNPIQQVIFILLASIMLGALGLLPNLLVAPLAAGIVRLGRRLHIPRLVGLLVALALFVAVEVLFQTFMSANFAEPLPPLIWAVIAAIASLVLMLYLWYRSRRFPPETLGAVGQLFLAAYLAAIVVSIPLVYPFTQHLS